MFLNGVKSLLCFHAYLKPDFFDNKLTARNRTVLPNCKQHKREDRSRVQKQHGGFQLDRK